jgi:uncharacterized protein (TIGR02001 family)
MLIAGATAISFTTDACAQLSGSVSVLSDYRFRGVSLSSEHPAAQADVNYDFASGWYTGAFFSTVRFDSYPRLHRQVVTYAGYAHRVSSDLSVDAGVSYADLSTGSDFDYLEVHTGVTAAFLNMQLSYAPKYFGQQRAGFYLEMNSGTQLTDSVRIFGHAGALYVQPAPYQNASGTQFDGRIGLRYERDAFNAQLSWVAVNRISLSYPVDSNQSRGTLVVQVALFF